MARNSLAEMADQGAANIAAAQTRKVEVSLANKAIHAYGGEDAVIEYIASGGTISALCKVLGIGNTTFDRWVEPRWKSGERVAYFGTTGARRAPGLGIVMRRRRHQHELIPLRMSDNLLKRTTEALLHEGECQSLMVAKR